MGTAGSKHKKRCQACLGLVRGPEEVAWVESKALWLLRTTERQN